MSSSGRSASRKAHNSPKTPPTTPQLRAPDYYEYSKNRKNCLFSGKHHVRNLFASSERPEKPCWLPPPFRIIWAGEEPKRVPLPPKEERCPYRTQWCEAGVVPGYSGIVDLNSIYSICSRRIRVDEDGRFVISSY